MDDIKLFVCCHAETPIPEHPLLVPIQVGATLADRRFPGFVQDDSGVNISEKNRSYCELTAQYWAWKNCSADYCGFFHYRRFLYPEQSERRPYIICEKPSAPLLEKLGYEGFDKLIRNCDLILPIGENMHVPVREHYAHAPYHHGEDLERMEQIVREYSPDYAAAMDRYLSGTIHYFGNIYIMRREVFRDYCAWLFPLLEEFDRRTDTGGYGVQEKRVDGYLAVRLLGVYCTKHHGELRCLELPRVHFEPDRKKRRKAEMINFLLPPGSKRRARVKKRVK